MAWYREWFGEEYLELYSHRDESEAEQHADFVARCLGAAAGRSPRAVLDLACGAGRHTAALRRRGYRTLGVDISLTLLARMGGLPKVSGDMRRLPFRAESFDWILSFFTSFGYFEQERENFRVLEEVVRTLAPGGRFLLDLMNPEPVIAQLKARETQQLEGRRVDIERWYDPAKKRINKRIAVEAPGGVPRAFLESVRVYQPDEVIIGLHWAGLEVDHVFGNFQGDRYARDSERLILISSKPA
jgi:SAM-dependent methyltransferase